MKRICQLFISSFVTLVAFLTFGSVYAFASGTFTASNIYFNPNTSQLSFTASGFSPNLVSQSGSNTICLGSTNQDNQVDGNHEYCYETGSNFFSLTDPFNFNHILSVNSYRPSSGTVYLLVVDNQAGGNQTNYFSQPLTYSTDFGFDGSFTASNITYDPATSHLTFHASGMSPALTSGDVTNTICIGNTNNGAAVDGSDEYCYENVSSPLTLTTPWDFSQTLTFNSFRPSNGTVYLMFADTTQGRYYLSQPLTYNNGLSYPPLSSSTISVSPNTGTQTVGTPFTVTVAVNSSAAFNAAKSSVSISSNLSIISINNAKTNPCNFNYTKAPTTADPSFAGAIFGSSSTGCNVYTMSLQPTGAGVGTITLNNSSIKAYSDSSELLTGVQNGSYTINTAAPTPTPPGTSLVTVDDSVQGSAQNQWNYVDNWSHCTDASNPGCNPNLYNNSVSWDNTTDDYATLAFTGRQILLYGLTDPNHGIADVSIDGGAETNVDFYSATRTGNVLLWTSPFVTDGQHTLKVRVTGTKNANSGGTYLAIDRADILETTPSNLTVTNTVFVTYDSTLTLQGTKDASITHVFVNGSETGVTYPTSTTWQATESVSLGNNDFIIYGTDANNNQTASINVLVNRHTLGDINGDGVVDLTDASLFAVDYGKTSNLTYPLSDMNGNGSVDLTDLSILAKLETN